MATRISDLLASAFDELRYEPTARRVRADEALDSTRAVLVWEPRRIVPAYAVPEADILEPVTDGPPSAPMVPGVLHPGIPFAVHSAAGTPVSIGGREGAGFRLDDLPGLVMLDTTAFTTWREEDEEVRGHPRSPVSRIDVRATSRRVRVERAGEVLAESDRARLLFETGLPTRFYVPKEDVRGELVPSTTTSYCPYKGQASYWTVGGHTDVAWSYERPLPDGPLVAGLVAFWNESVELFLDGEPVGAPRGMVVETMRDEFGLD